MQDCAGGICTPDLVCLQVCVEGEEECGERRLCGTVSLTVGGVEAEVPACVADPGSGQACTRDADCPEGEGCRPEPGEAEDAVVLVCRPGAGEGPAVRCDSPWECLSGYCMPGRNSPDVRSCFGACIDGDDCGGLPCVEQPVGLPGREAVALAACLDPRQPCGRDGDCPVEGHVCAPQSSEQDPAVLRPLCEEPVGEGGGGVECADDAECASGLCVMLLDPSACWQPCVGDEDCAEGMRCYDDVAPVEVEGGYAGLPACLPDRGSLDPCAKEQDCLPDESCTALANAARDDLLTRCAPPPDPPTPDCDALDGGPCRSGICYIANPLIPLPSCLQVCEADGDCPLVMGFFQTVCQPGEFAMGSAEAQVTGELGVCTIAF